MLVAGLETLIRDGIHLPHFAAFPLLKSDQGRSALRRYYDSSAFRASPDWASKVGYRLKA